MGDVRPLPKLGGVFSDAQRPARALRVSWHHDAGVVVLSLWDGPRCTGTVRVQVDDVPDVISALMLGLRAPKPLAAAAPPEPDDPHAEYGPPTDLVPLTSDDPPTEASDG